MNVCGVTANSLQKMINQSEYDVSKSLKFKKEPFETPLTLRSFLGMRRTMGKKEFIVK